VLAGLASIFVYRTNKNNFKIISILIGDFNSVFNSVLTYALTRVKRYVKVSKLGIKTHGTTTFGHPEDTRDTLNETLEFMKRSSLATWQVSVVTPFPGTPLYHWLKAAGRLKDAHGKDFNGNGNCIIAYPPESGLTSDYVENFHARAMKKWKRHKLKDQKWLGFHLRLVARAMWSNPGIILSRAKQTMESWASKTKSTAPAAQPPIPALAGR
jgi:hypothetical protein